MQANSTMHVLQCGQAKLSWRNHSALELADAAGHAQVVRVLKSALGGSNDDAGWSAASVVGAAASVCACAAAAAYRGRQ